MNPAATEIPGDGADQNCDGVETCFEDADGDGARTGSFVVGSVSCTGPGEALASADPDCDDGNGSVYPNGTELAGNLLDDDCDTHWLCYVDADEDNARSQATAQGSAACSGPTDALESAPEDCDDLDPTVSPLVNERAGNLEDENCDGVIDCYADADFDGWTSTGVVASADGDCDDLGEGLRDVPPDCNDTDPAISPEAVEVVGDGVDQNCDTLDTPPPDLDGDGANASVDCDDLDSAVNPSAAEIAVDGRDQNCDGLEDCFADEDLDSIGSDSFVQSDDLDCDDPGESTISGDPCPEVQGVVCPDDTGHTGHTGMGHTGTGHTGTGHTGQTGTGHTGSGLHTGTDSTTAEHTGAGDTGVDDTAAPAPDPGCGCDVGGAAGRRLVARGRGRRHGRPSSPPSFGGSNLRSAGQNRHPSARTTASPTSPTASTPSPGVYDAPPVATTPIPHPECTDATSSRPPTTGSRSASGPVPTTAGTAAVRAHPPAFPRPPTPAQGATPAAAPRATGSARTEPATPTAANGPPSQRNSPSSRVVSVRTAANAPTAPPSWRATTPTVGHPSGVTAADVPPVATTTASSGARDLAATGSAAHAVAHAAIIASPRWGSPRS